MQNSCVIKTFFERDCDLGNPFSVAQSSRSKHGVLTTRMLRQERPGRIVMDNLLEQRKFTDEIRMVMSDYGRHWLCTSAVRRTAVTDDEVEALAEVRFELCQAIRNQLLGPIRHPDADGAPRHISLRNSPCGTTILRARLALRNFPVSRRNATTHQWSGSDTAPPSNTHRATMPAGLPRRRSSSQVREFSS
jgi:hypothetical protein